MLEHGSSIDQATRVTGYYETAPLYRDGVLDGRCHFGYTPDNCRDPYDLHAAQLNMQRLLGNTLNLPAGSTVLDAGCGYGPVARTLTTEFSLNVHGIDITAEHLKEAKRLNIEGGIPRIGMAEADYHHLPFPDNSFDGVFTMETLVHADPFEKVLAELLRVLKPGGKLVLFEYSIPDLQTLHPFVRNMASQVIDRTAMSSLPRFIHGSFPKYLENAGFENVKVRDISRNVWPTWYFLWKDALQHTGEQILHGTFHRKNLRGSTMIYPARRHLGYMVCEALKPISSGTEVTL